MLRIIGIAPLALAATLVAGAATAQSVAAASAPVRLSDLDLARDADRLRAKDRIDAAARRLCEPEPSALFPRGSAHAWRCRLAAREDATERLPAPPPRLARRGTR